MSEKKASWDDIPSISGLGVDWEYEPESALGKRTKFRIMNADLQQLIGKKHVAVKVVAKNLELNASLMDISQIGLALYIEEKLPEDTPVRIGMYLGKQKIIARAMNRNINQYKDGYRIGLEFVELDIDAENFIAGLVSSTVFKQI